MALMTERQLIAQNRCQLYRQNDFTASINGWFPISFTEEDFDGNTMHDNSSLTERITIRESGWYNFGGVIRFNTPGTLTGMKLSRFNSSGTNLRGGVMVFYSNTANIINASKDFYLNAGDYLVLNYFTNAATSITGVSGEPESTCSFWAVMRSK